jgi:hypothetical protein
MPVKPPFRLAVAALFLDGDRLSPEEVLASLAGEYARAGFFGPKAVALCLQCLSVNGILREETGRYLLTGYGRERVRKNLGG